MHETLPPEIQRRLRALHAYMRAMEYGDLESVAQLLRAAEQDAALSSMFQEVDLYYQAQEQMLLAEDEQEAFLQADYAEVQQVRLPGVSALSPLAQEGRITAMYSEPEHSLIEQQSLAGPQARTEANTSPRRRSLRFFRTLAAAVVVLVLLGCFLVIYARPGLPGPSTSSTTTGPAQPSGLLFGITATTLLNSNSTTYTAYALHAANKTPSWSTRLSTIKGTGSFQPPVLIRQQALYTVIGNLALALDTKSGHILWQKTLPLDPTGQATLQMDGDLLVAGGQDIHSASFIYRLDEQRGTLLWHYQLGPEPIYAVSHGVVYVGLDQVTSMNTPNPGSLRFLIALKGTNGSVIWQKDHVLVTDITVLNGVLYVQNMPVDNVGSDKHYFLDAWTTSGTRLWDIPLSLYRAPVLDSGLLIVSTQTNPNTGATEICAYHPENGHKAWCKPQQFIAYQVQNGVIYLEYTQPTGIPLPDPTELNGDAAIHHQYVEKTFLEAIDLHTQKVLWSRQIGAYQSTFTRGVNHATPTVTSQRTGVTSISMESSPLLAGQTLVFAAGTNIIAYSLDHGQQLWQIDVKITTSVNKGDSVSFVSLGYTEP